MLSKKVKDLLNAQVNAEFYSAYLYLDFSNYYKDERLVTSLINTIYDAAHKDKDYRTMQFLDWFVKEQAEEEENADDNVKKFELFGDDAKGLYMLDSEMKSRVYTAPSLTLD